MDDDPQGRLNWPGHARHLPPRPPDAADDPHRGELWGLCDVCDRWYFFAFEPGVNVRSPRCPVCESVPARVTLRLVAGPDH